MSLIKERDIQERDEVYRDKDDSKSYYGKSYRQLKDMADDLVTLLPTLHRKTVKNDCHCFLNSILDELKRRKHLCDSRCKEIQNLKSKLDQQMKQIQSTYFQLYSSVFANNKVKKTSYFSLAILVEFITSPFPFAIAIHLVYPSINDWVFI